MQTRAKSEIFKPKNWGAFLADSSNDFQHIEPSSVKVVLQLPCWKVAMDMEMEALK